MPCDHECHASQIHNHQQFVTTDFHQHLIGGATICCSPHLTYGPYLVHYKTDQKWLPLGHFKSHLLQNIMGSSHNSSPSSYKDSWKTTWELFV